MSKAHLYRSYFIVDLNVYTSHSDWTIIWENQNQVLLTGLSIVEGQETMAGAALLGKTEHHPIVRMTHDEAIEAMKRNKLTPSHVFTSIVKVDDVIDELILPKQSA